MPNSYGIIAIPICSLFFPSQSSSPSRVVINRKMSADAPRDESLKEPDSDYGESSAKLWSIYVNATKKYDKALVESWKGDMDGILIFAGLFSASVTAFLVESTKLLKPSQVTSDPSTEILAHMSLQFAAMSNALAAMANTSVAPVPAYQRGVADASVPNYALRVNILWFLSLLLSLLCALGATLIQGWARNYLHAVEYHTAPHQRARIRAFLFHGIEQSRMKTIVDGVPALLHMSLFLFITGMQQNLAPINHTISLLILIMLVIYAGIYIATSVLPIIKLNFPYQTPLSSVLWHAKQLLLPLHFRDFRLQKISISTGGNLSRGISEFAMNSAMQSRYYDAKALSWTLSAITEDSTLVAFIDGIPGYLHSAQVSDPISTMLELITEHKLGMYISQILESCDAKYSLSRELQIQRGNSCLHAISALVIRLNQYIPNKKWTACFPAVTAATIVGLTYKRPQYASFHLQACCTSALMYWTVLDEYEQLIMHARQKLFSLVSYVTHIGELPVTSMADDYPYIPSHAIKIRNAKEEAKFNIKSALQILKEDPFVLWQEAIFNTIKLLNQRSQIYKGIITDTRIEATLNSQCAETKNAYLYPIEEDLMTEEMKSSKMPVLKSVFEYLSFHSEALHYILSLDIKDPLSDHDIKMIKDCLSYWCSKSAPNEIWEMLTAAHIGNFIQLTCTAIDNLFHLTETDVTEIMETLHSIRVSALPSELTEKMQIYLVILLKFVKEKHLEIIDDWKESPTDVLGFHINTTVQIAESVILFSVQKLKSNQLLIDIQHVLIEWQKKSSSIFKIIQEVIPTLSEKLGKRTQSLNHDRDYDYIIQPHFQLSPDRLNISIPAREYRESFENNYPFVIRRRHPHHGQQSVFDPDIDHFESGTNNQISTSIQLPPLHIGINTYGFSVPNSAWEIGQSQAPTRAEVHELPDSPQAERSQDRWASTSSIQTFASARPGSPPSTTHPSTLINHTTDMREPEPYTESISDPGSPLELLHTPNPEQISLPRIFVDAGTP